MRVLLGIGLVLAVVAAAAWVFDDAPRRVVVNLPDGARYEGGFRDGRFHGAGVYDWPDGRRYAGELRAGLPNGQGVMTYPDGARYEGGFRDDEFDGEGVYTFPDGRELAGEFRAGVFHGEGRCLNRALGYPCPDSRTDEPRRRAGVSA